MVYDYARGRELVAAASALLLFVRGWLPGHVRRRGGVGARVINGDSPLAHIVIKRESESVVCACACDSVLRASHSAGTDYKTTATRAGLGTWSVYATIAAAATAACEVDW